MTTLTSRAAVAASLLGMLILAGCTDNGASTAPDESRTIAVSASDTACTLAMTSVPSGKLTFRVTNKGTKVTEFYLLGADGQRIISEVEDLGPGLTRDLVVEAPAGDYVTACKPGMTGDGIRGDFKVTGA